MDGAALQFDKSSNFSRWLGPNKEERETDKNSRWKSRREIFQQTEREDLAKHAEALANGLKAGSGLFYFMDVIEYVEAHRKALEMQADALRAEGPFWQVSEYTEEEFNAFMEADQWPPELAERYKDLLED